MTEELNKTEARQGDRRRTNVTALVVGMVLIVIVFVVMLSLYA